MVRDQLALEILQWAQEVVGLPPQVLEKSWDWQGYSEGIRFAFFRVMEELRAMAVDDVCRQPGSVVNPSASVQQLLTNYHAAYWDLRALCLNLTDETASKKPGDEEWSLKEVIQHTLDAEWAFFGIFQYTYRFRGTKEEWNTEKIPESFFDFHFSDDCLYDEAAFKGDLSQLLDFYEKLHRQIMLGLGKFSDEKLQDDLLYWEPQPMKARFRLIRFEAHLRQHTIQAEKTIKALGINTSQELQRLVEICLQAFAVLDAVLLFHPDLDQNRIMQVWVEKVSPYLQIILDSAST